MTDYLSQKIKYSSFVLMLMVVLLHCYNFSTKIGGHVIVLQKDVFWFIEQLLSNGLTRIAVPLFFIISGYLFVLNSKFTAIDFWNKIKKRISTLVVPYLIWALFGLIFYLVIQSIPQFQSFFNKKLIKDYSMVEWINSIINEPIPYQLWFLRDLIVLVGLSPLLYFMIKKLPIVYLLGLFGFWIFNQDSFFLTSESILFFSLGMYLHIYKIEKTPRKPLLFCSLWLLIVAIKTVYAIFYNVDLIELFLLKTSILLGLIGFWQIYDVVYDSGIKVPLMKKWVPYTFFIYVFHEPLLTVVKKSLFHIVAKTSVNYFIVYISSFIIVICSCVVFGFLVKSTVPSVYKIITGNR